MTQRFAKVLDGTILEYRDEPPLGNQSQLPVGKPRWLPVEVTMPEFDPVSQVRTGPVMTVLATKVKEVYAVRAKNAAEVDAMRAAKIAEIKEAARQRILAVLPEHAQLNALALGQEAVLTHGPDPSSWPTELQQINQALMTKWATIKAIRVRSNELEAPLAAMGAADIDAVDSAAGWE